MVSTPVSLYFSGRRLGHIIETNCIKFPTIDSVICQILTQLGLVSPPHFVYDFSRKVFLMLYSLR